MTQEIDNNADNMEVPEEGNQNGDLQPVKGKQGKLLSIGSKIVVGGAIITFIGSLLTPSRAMGATRSSRLELEKRKTEYEKVIQKENAKQDRSEIAEERNQVGQEQ